MSQESIPPIFTTVAARAGRASAARSRTKSHVGKQPPAAALPRFSMTGNSKTRIVLQERDRHLLKEIAVMRVVDREQAKCVAGFGSLTRANSRLLALTRAG